MEIVLWLEQKNLQNVKDALLKDDEISRASIIFKEAKTLTNKQGYYCYISGTEEQCKKVLEKIKEKEIAKRVEEEEEKSVIQKIKEESEKADVGFGFIFQG
ncbi:MAG: hypothetical protein QW451_02035 [Candidatus Aenigmatarchaeota archaeon]